MVKKDRLNRDITVREPKKPRSDEREIAKDRRAGLLRSKRPRR